MKAIDSLLKILVQNGATELQLASDRPPQMFKDGFELAFTIPAMSTQRIRELLGDLWTSHVATLREHSPLHLEYASAELGAFELTLAQAPDSTLKISFRRAGNANAPNDASKREAPRELDAARGISAEGGRPGFAEPSSALTALLTRAVRQGASDLHLSPQRAPIVRVNGVLQVLDDEAPLDAIALLGDGAVKQLRSGRSVDQALDVAGLGRVRINVYASEEGVCAAVRILRREAPALAALQLPAQLESLVDLPHGLIVVCGPTGCGKSTTLAALIQHALRARPQVLITLEDPIEYVIRPLRPTALVRQREVGTHVYDFATGLRDALREDPDILLVGEMRDPETISLALTAAETGHLVFATLHSRTAPSAVERIIDTYAPERQRQIRVQLADSLRAVVSQRLIPTVDGSGRVPAVELLRVTHGVANLIREARTPQIVNALQAGGNEGMMVLERSLAELVRSNRIRRETAMAAANEPSTLGEYLRAGTT